MDGRDATAGLAPGLMAFGIRPDERAAARQIATLFAVTQASHGLGANAADTLFFLRFGVEELPQMILLSGIVVMAAIVLHAIRLTSRGAADWLWVVALLAAGWVALERVGIASGWRPVYAVVWVSTQAVVMVTFTMMWNAAAGACTTRQAKRLFPLFATAGVAGGIVGNLLTGPAASLLGTGNLLLLQAALLAGSAVVLRRARGLLTDGADGAEAPHEIGAGFDAVRSSRLLQLATVTAFAMSVLWFLVVFPFNEVVTEAFGSEEDLAFFLGVFSSASTAATFLVSLFVTNRLFARIGVVVALMLVPVMYAAGMGVWLASFGLVPAVALRGAQWVIVNGIGATAYSALFNVLTGRRRGQIMAFMLAIPTQIGTMAAGAILLAGSRLGQTARFSMGLAVAVGLLFAVVAMRGAYLDAVLRAVRRGLVGLFDTPPQGVVTVVDAEARRVLESRLFDPRPEARAIAIDALTRLGVRLGADQVSTLMADGSPLVRAAAFDSMCAVEPDRIDRHAAVALADESPEVRLRALRYLALGSAEHVVPTAAAGALWDSDPRVRAAAAALAGDEAAREAVRSLVESGDADALVAVLDEVVVAGEGLGVDPRPHLAHPEPRVRTAAIRALGALGEGQAELLPALDDPALPVRRAAAAALARSERGHDLLMEVLRSGSVHATDAALRALTPLEDPTPHFVEWARREAHRAAHLSRMRRALDGQIGCSGAGFLQDVLQQRSRRLVDWVLRAVTTDANSDAMSTVARGIRSDDAETRSQAIEALESVGRGPAITVLVPLLEDGPEAGGLGAGEALRELSGDFDPWLRAIATRCLAEEIASDLDALGAAAAEDDSDLVRSAVPSFTIVQPDHVDSLDVMERVLALRRVVMFQELDPEELELIAGAAREAHYEPGALVFRRGEEGDEMLIIVDGTAVVGGPAHPRWVVLGPGEHVGELALLGAGQRSMDVTAGPDGLHALVIGKTDLLAVLGERPGVALGMLRTLATRLADAV